MLNMIRLDWAAMKYYHKRSLLILVVLFIIGCINNPIYLIPLTTFFLFLFSLNPFAAEEKGDLNRLYLTLPVQRRSAVRGRYCLSLILFLIGILLGRALMPLVNLVALSKWYPDLKWTIALFSFSFLLYALMNLSMYPLLFKLGYQKGQFWGMYIPMGIFGLLYLLYVMYASLPGHEKLELNMLVYASEHMLLVSGGMCLAAAVILTVSYLLSVHAYAKREF